MPFIDVLHASATQSLNVIDTVPHIAPHLRPGVVLSAAALHDVSVNTLAYTAREDGTAYFRSAILLSALMVAAQELDLNPYPAYGASQRPAVAIDAGGQATLVTPWEALLREMTPDEGVKAGLYPTVDTGIDYAQMADTLEQVASIQIDALNADAREASTWTVHRHDHCPQLTLDDPEAQACGKRLADLYQAAGALIAL